MPAPIPKEDVLADIRRVAEKLDKVPTRREYDEHGEYSQITPRAKCGSWTAAREAAGLTGGPTKNTYVPDEEILGEIERVAESLGESPSQEQFNEHGEYSHILVCDRFGSWNVALEKCGLPTEQDTRIPDEQLLSDIQEVADAVESVPSQSDYREDGTHGLSVVKRRFGQWSTAVRKAGFEPHTVGPGTGEDNPSWRGGYDPYYGENWYAQRRAARERDDYECQHCGMSDAEHKEEFGWELEVHHITPVRKFEYSEEANDLSNLITLCRTHHRKWEATALRPREP